MLGVDIYFIENTYLSFLANLLVEISPYVFCIASDCLSFAVTMRFVGSSNLWFVFRDGATLSISEKVLAKRSSVALDSGSLGNTILNVEVPISETSGC